MPTKSLPKPTSKFHNFFPPEVKTFTSDRSIDFKLKDGEPIFNEEQKAYLIHHLGTINIVNIKQVHGDHIVLVTKNYIQDEDTLDEADALVTHVRGRGIAIRTADCTPVYLYDPRHKCIGLVHAGWKSTEKEIVRQTIELMMEKWDTRPEDVLAAIGPSIRCPSFEVGEDFLFRFPRATIMKGDKYYCDVPLANKNQLYDIGVREDHIYDCGEDTFRNKNYDSFRRDGEASGRMIHVMMIV